MQRAVTVQGLDYRALKAMVRASLEHSFAADEDRARLQAQLESDLVAFETRFTKAEQ
jgi:hypothetical protein